LADRLEIELPAGARAQWTTGVLGRRIFGTISGVAPSARQTVGGADWQENLAKGRDVVDRWVSGA
jgi:hypothetical protein